MRTILITSVGSLVGHNILESLASRRQEWRIVGVNSLALAANNFRCDAAYLVTVNRVRVIREIVIR